MTDKGSECIFFTDPRETPCGDCRSCLKHEIVNRDNHLAELKEKLVVAVEFIEVDISPAWLPAKIRAKRHECIAKLKRKKK